MFATKFTTILYLAIALALSTSTEAKGYASHNANLKRIVRKRAPFPADDFAGAVSGGAGADPVKAIIEPIASASVSVPATSVSVVASSTTVSSSTSASSTVSSVVSSSAVSSTVSSSASSVSSSVASSSSSSVSSSAADVPSSTAPVETPSVAPSPTNEPINVTNEPVAPSTKFATVYSTAAVPSQSAESLPVASGATSKPSAKKTTLTVLIVIASIVGGIAIFWTIFRKWKLARSSKFDQRLQPIDWQPTADDASPNLHRSPSMASSFHSASGHNEKNSISRGYGATANVPEHDFTAPASTLAPIGGYADLARGPSPQMQDLNRGPSMNRPAYGSDDYNHNGPRY